MEISNSTLQGFESIPSRLMECQNRLEKNLAIHGRDKESAQLIAVSKTFPPAAIEQAYQVGQQAFGENYVQEAVEKIQSLKALNIQWHFIGPIQSNKTLLIAEHFDWVHSISRLKIAQRLSDARGSDRLPLQVCLQVNVSGELSKEGCNPREVKALAEQIIKLPNLKLRGLMTIPEATTDSEKTKSSFAQLRSLHDDLKAAGIPVDTLSMGMSDDMDIAIAEGSTMVRIGRGIFGERARR
jgi:pyridoxal phosphate enzyme (YggS family)